MDQAPTILHLKGEFLTSGSSDLLSRLPSGDIIKEPWPGFTSEDSRKEMTIENSIYEKLGPHPRLVEIHHWDPDDCSLTMEYMPNGSLNPYIDAHHDTISTPQRLQWIMEAAEGLQLLHSANIIHCDAVPRNFLLDANLGLRIADFGGSVYEGWNGTAWPGSGFALPDGSSDARPTVQFDFFALGSTIYVIMTGREPFHELSSDEVGKLFSAQEFPDTTEIIIGEIISGCWHGEFTSAQEIYDLVHRRMISGKFTAPCPFHQC